MPDTTTPEIIKFLSDMTLRWPCFAGDFLMCFGYDDIFSGPEAIKCYDLGRCATVTMSYQEPSRGFAFWVPAAPDRNQRQLPVAQAGKAR
jgi:hypothetical protein